MKNILVKSGVGQLDCFKGQKFPYFEAYTTGEEDLNLLLNTEMKLISLHMPSTVSVEGKRYPTNFCDAGPVGEASFKKLQEYLDFSQKNKVSNIIVHLGFFNSFTEDRYAILERTAKLFSRLETGNVRICIENIPCWTNISFENEPIISSAEHFIHFQKTFPWAGATFDVDHHAINTVFQQFYALFKQRYKEFPDKDKFKSLMEEEMVQATNKDPLRFKKLVEKGVVSYLSKITPTTIHAAGSDYCNYLLKGRLPLVGEELPLGYEGIIESYNVEDRLHHSSWISHLKNMQPLPFITIETAIREEYDHLAEVRRSYEWLVKELGGTS